MQVNISYYFTLVMPRPFEKCIVWQSFHEKVIYVVDATLGTPPQADTHRHTHPPGQIPPDGHAADATHPTGMYSCSVKIIFIASQELLDLYSVRYPMYMLIFEKHFANFNVKQVRMIQKLKDIHLSIIMLEDHFCS